MYNFACREQKRPREYLSIKHSSTESTDFIANGWWHLYRAMPSLESLKAKVHISKHSFVVQLKKKKNAYISSKIWQTIFTVFLVGTTKWNWTSDINLVCFKRQKLFGFSKHYKTCLICFYSSFRFTLRHLRILCVWLDISFTYKIFGTWYAFLLYMHANNKTFTYTCLPM